MHHQRVFTVVREVGGTYHCDKIMSPDYGPFFKITGEKQLYFLSGKTINCITTLTRWYVVIPLNNQRLKCLEKKDTVMLYE